MKVQQHISLLSILLAAAPWTYAQQPIQSKPQDNAPRLETEAPHWYSRFTYRYESKIAPPINVANSTRIDSLLRAGKLYLSLQDAIALALENNIDINRYNFQLADIDLNRAKTGGAIRGIAAAGGGGTNAVVGGGAAGGAAGATGGVGGGGVS